MKSETPREREERLYRKSVDAAAVARQDAAAGARHPCCWQHFETGHHPLCRNAPDPEQEPAFLEGQVALA